VLVDAAPSRGDDYIKLDLTRGMRQMSAFCERYDYVYLCILRCRVAHRTMPGKTLERSESFRLPRT